ALVLWIPDLATPAGPALSIDYIGMVGNAALGLDEALKADGLKSTFTVYVPESVDADTRNSIEADLKLNVARAVPKVLTHKHAAPLSLFMEGQAGIPDPIATVLFVDPLGVVRVADGLVHGHRYISNHLRLWLGVFEAIASSRRSPTDPKGG